MKRKSFVALLLIALIITFSATGCDISDFGNDNLLRPPKTIGNEAEIEQLIAKTADNNYTLKYPKSGNYRSAIITIDLNNDKKDEAVAFYVSGKDTTQLHMLVMYCDNKNVWKLSSDSITETTDVDSVDFADINGNKSLEIIAGYTTFANNINRLSCYSYDNGKTTEITSGQNYSSFYCGDFNKDGSQEIMSLLLYTTDNLAQANMLDYNKDKNALYSKATVAMDPNVVKYKNVTVANVDDNGSTVIVDGQFATNEIDTQIIFYNNELSLLRNPLYNEKKKNLTLRSNDILCCDINDDKKIELPITSKLSYEKTESSDAVADEVIWNSFNTANETFVPVSILIENYTYNYSVAVPEKWLDNNVTARIDTKKSTMSFYEWTKNKLGKMLFEIKVFEINNWDIGKDSDKYTLITKDDKYAYAFVNKNSDSKYSLSDDEIKTAFSVNAELVI